MKLPVIPSGCRAAARVAPAAHTLIEMMFASAILTMVVLALMSAHMLGLREDQLVESKAGASDSSRRVLNQLPVDIRRCKMWAVGNLTSVSNFTSISDNSAQRGTALQLFERTNGSQYILYFFDLSDSTNNNGKLMRTESTNWNPVVMASNLVNSQYYTNSLNFTAEDYNGNVATNHGTSRAFKNVIHTTLQFCQFQYPLTQVGSNGLYDFYILNFTATPHLPE